MGVHVVTRSCYIGGFIGEPESEKVWLAEKVARWTDSVKVLAGVAHRHLQKSYAAIQKPLQKEWDFIQSNTPDIGEAFCSMEEALQNSLLPTLFQGATD